jgi:nucleotide-binding universal stress UspA family protein
MMTDPTDGGLVVAVDGSPATDPAIRWGAEEAALHGWQLTLAHVLTPEVIDVSDPRLRKRIHRWRNHCGRAFLAEKRAALAAAMDVDVSSIRAELRYGHPVQALSEVSIGASMMVVGSRFHGSIGGRRFGSVSAALCHRAHCPVTVVHDLDADLSGRPVVVGIDGSPASECATAIAFDEASRRRVDLIAVHAWSDVGVFPLLGMDWHMYREQADEVLGERLAGWQERYPDVVVTRRVYCDCPAHWLIEEAGESGLVVVGSHGRGAVTSLMLGSVATAVAEAVDVPVIVARTA